jgi:hypothetical protein
VKLYFSSFADPSRLLFGWPVPLFLTFNQRSNA